MRLRLVHTLSLLLLSAVLVAVLAMGAFTAWHLKNGFGNYLAARDVARLDRFAAFVSDAAERAGGIEAFEQRRLDLPELLHGFALAEGVAGGDPPPRGGPRGGFGGPPFDAPPPPRDGPPRFDGPPTRDRPPRFDGPPPRDRPPAAGDERFGSRVTLIRLDGRPLTGRTLATDRGPFVERPVRAGGEAIARVRMLPSERVPDVVERDFLRSQYLGIFAVSGVLMLLALAGAWWVAGRWVRPLSAVKDATARIARGQLDVRLGEPAHGLWRTDEIGDVVRNVNRMAEGLQRLESARRRWVADLSHELRTPLAVLRGEIEALVDGVRPLRPEAMASLREEVLRLVALVDDLHLLAMSDLQALPCRFTDADAAQLLRQAARRFAPRAAAAGLVLALPPDGAATLPVRWDPARIEQLLDNLLENSLRYTDAPGRIALAVACDGGTVTLDVADSAPAVPASELPRLFEPLYRADAARSRHDGGSGLGLAICEAIVRSHGGRIEAGASPLGGLRVRVVLPAFADAGTGLAP